MYQFWDIHVITQRNTCTNFDKFMKQLNEIRLSFHNKIYKSWQRGVTEWLKDGQVKAMIDLGPKCLQIKACYIDHLGPSWTFLSCWQACHVRLFLLCLEGHTLQLLHTFTVCVKGARLFCVFMKVKHMITTHKNEKNTEKIPLYI